MDTSASLNLPPVPPSVTDTGLGFGFIADLALKTIYARHAMLGYEIADSLKLPFADVVAKVLEYLRQAHFVDVRGSEAIGEPSYRYVITIAGQTRARELMDRNGYVGPAPVTLPAYIAMVNAQSLEEQSITQETLRSALSQLVLNDEIINQLGPVMVARRSVFLFGNTGNGKTSIGLSIGNILPSAIWVPYAITVEDQIIKIFDDSRHRVIAKKTADKPVSRRGLLSYLTKEKTDGVEVMLGISDQVRYDERWVLVHRPLIVGGGELTLKNLDLVYDSKMKTYEAPQQLKANGGVFLLDDLGRQAASPREILNRWIVPLEKRVDYLSLATGFKFEVPFDVFVVFATNLDPKDLADEAFLRRIRYKIQLPDPTWDEYREIIQREAAKRSVPFSEQGLQYLLSEYYLKPKRQPRGVHPRDILDAMVDIAHFQGIPPAFSQELINLACQAYFIASLPDETV
ncbi:MAG: ATP-binding protein [Chloroflexi bacterium]|nr:ATP-binding protein [Chloroflexota bacterium]